ncbi:hypothetical protein L1887_03107 [Cichorium endivia]|nr:hypothetical protein L1887_03107 [Cichorium endivia]
MKIKENYSFLGMANRMAGFAASSTDGRVTLMYFNPSNQNNDGGLFRFVFNRDNEGYIFLHIEDDSRSLPSHLQEFLETLQVDDEVRLEDDWVPMDEQLGAGELEEVIRAKEAHSRAVVLESV